MGEMIIHILQGIALLALSLDSILKTTRIQQLEGEVRRLTQQDPIEQRCGTCTKRYTCPAWPGVIYPCPHYNDQDGIMEEKLRKDFMDDD